LSNTTVKIITKLLANSLQAAIIPLIHENQYGFIKSRTIQDCLGWTFEYIYQCHKSKRECIILKLDFTKAFDTIEHNTIIQMLIHKGFTETWIRWINAIFESLVNSYIKGEGSIRVTLSHPSCLSWLLICFRVSSTRLSNRVFSPCQSHPEMMQPSQ
jgi:hypothetical protein